MCQHFYHLMGKAEEAAKALYEQNQQAKGAYVKAHAVNRSHGGAGMSKEEFEEFTEAWEGLKYYKMQELDAAKTKGFNAKSKGLYVFSKIFRHIEGNIEGDVHVSEENWKMNFTMKAEAEAI